MGKKDNHHKAPATKKDGHNNASGFLKTTGGVTPSHSIHIPSIALPGGGGAIKGIDEKFTVNAMNGTAGFSIPLPFSHARGVTPVHNLSYNSGGGNGIFGLGWNIGLPSIKRKTDKGLPQYLDATDSDIYLISDADDLVPEFNREADGSFTLDGKGDYVIKEKNSADNSFRIRSYRPRIEGLFSRIERWTNKNSNEIKWRVISKDNVTTLFGWSNNSRITDPADDSRTFEWLPEFIFDDKGNCAHYLYKQEDETGLDLTLSHNRNRFVNGKITYANAYPEKILYGNKTPYKKFGDAFPGADKYLFSAIFDYGEYNENAPYQHITNWSFRADSFSNYKAGFEIRTTRLCKRVLFLHHFSGAGEYEGLVRSVNFEYDTSTQQSFTFLKAATVNGYIHQGGGVYSHKALPSMEFAYQKHAWNTELKFVTAENFVHAPVGIDDPHYQFTDLFNEGLSGILSEQANGWYYKHNLGDGKFEQARLVTPKPSYAATSNKFQLADLNADGGKQLVSYHAEAKGYFELTDDNDWQGFRHFQDSPTINFSDPNARMIDLDGDGKPELMISEEMVFTWYPSEGKKGFGRSHKSIKSLDEEAGPKIVFAEEKQTVFLADMSGNGMSDIVRIRNGEVCYWPNLGFGKFGAKITMDQSPVFDHTDIFHPAFIRLADIDGSGTTDIIYLGKNKFSCWMNLNGNRFANTPFEINAFPEIHQQAKINVTDLLGNGVPCIVWSSALPKDAQRPIKYIDLMGGRKPHLMTFHKNNLGKEITIEYTPSTRFYVEDKLAGTPWITKLHFPVQCVSKLITEDKVSGHRFTSLYKYHHGYYDHPEREFRGFGMVEQTDAEEFEHFVKGNASTLADQKLHQEPVVSKTWFHTGAYLSREKTFRQFAHEYWYAEMARKGISVTHHEADLPDARLAGGKGISNAIIDSLSAEEWQEALRACKGSALRLEVFAKDAAANGNTPDAIKKELTPYSVATHNYIIELLQPRGKNRFAVFVIKESENIGYNYEREPEDPRISHHINIRLDTFGNVLESASIVYPRLVTDASLPAVTQQEQARTLISYKENKFTNDFTDDILFPDIMRLPLPSEEITWELKAVSKSGQYYRPDDFQDILSNARSSDAEYHELNIPLVPGKAQKRIIEHTRALFYNKDLTGPMSLHHTDSLALPFEDYQLAYTPGLLEDIFAAKVPLAADRNDLMTEGKFVHSEGDSNWWVPSGTTQYIEGAETESDAKNRFYVPVSFTDPYLAKTKVSYYGSYFLFISQTEDALGNKSSVDKFNFRTLEPRRIKDINANISETITDELGMVKAMAQFGKGSEADDLSGLNEYTSPAEQNLIDEFFNLPETPDGITDSVMLTTKAKQLLQHATSRFIYDLDVYKNSGKPAAAVTIVREEHYQKNNNSPVHISFEYSNGLNKVVMKKSQAEPGPAKKTTVHNDGTYSVSVIDTSLLAPKQLRWIGNGKTILNNKGNPVKQYEPYFSGSCKYEDFKELVETGVTPLLYYDPIGRLVKTELPDETFLETKFNSWKQAVYDANDNVLRSEWYNKRFNRLIDAELLAEEKDPVKEKEAAEKAAKHADTPNIMHLDTLGRPILSVDHNRNLLTNADEYYRTKVTLDIESNLRIVTDARELVSNANKGNEVVSYKYDMLGHTVYHKSMDDGQRWQMTNILGNPLRTWDERNYEFRYFYDIAHRPTHSVVLGGETLPLLNNIFDRIFYGESLLLPGRTNEAAVQAKNCLGAAIKHYDTGGLLETPEYDFKGHALSVSRTLFENYKATVNWTDPNLALDLEPGTHTYTTETDALGRITKQTAPDLSVVTPAYNEAGLLDSESVHLLNPDDTTTYIKGIDYNEKGIRSKIIYGNDVLTRFYYDIKTFRLRRIETRRKNADLLQDLYYTFDAAGNITHIEDKAVPDVFFDNVHVEPASVFTYDALYRLRIATGRENNAALAVTGRDNWNDAPFIHDLNPGNPVALREYTQKYNYDEVGNITLMDHDAPGNLWARIFTYENNSNRLKTTQVGASTYSYSHHPQHGFINVMPHLEEMGWSFKEELVKSVRQRRLDGGTPETTYYQYDGHGQRIRKITENEANPGITPTKKDERIYIQGYELYKKHSGPDAGLQRRSLSLLDGEERFVMIETRNGVDDDTEERLVRYQLHNQIGSSALELEGSSAAKVISYEEYHPFGTTAYRARNAAIKSAAKRYRYTGMERDDETGLEYHSARYYIPWLGRWLSADPIGVVGGIDVYAYVNNNAISHTDTSGLQPHPRPRRHHPPQGHPGARPNQRGGQTNNNRNPGQRPGRIRSGARAGGRIRRTPDELAAAPAADPSNPRQITQIDVYYRNASRTGPVRIVLHHGPNRPTTRMTGMGGGAVDRSGHVHTTTTRQGRTTDVRYRVHTSSTYPSATPNMRLSTPFGGGEAFHQGPLGSRSHGCIHLSEADARNIMQNTPAGVEVNIGVEPAQRGRAPARPPAHHAPAHPAPRHPAPPAQGHPRRPQPAHRQH